MEMTEMKHGAGATRKAVVSSIIRLPCLAIDVEVRLPACWVIFRLRYAELLSSGYVIRLPLLYRRCVMLLLLLMKLLLLLQQPLLLR